MTATTVEIPGYVQGTWSIDPAHSEIGFVARHMMVSKVRGRFTDFTGEVVSAANPTESRATASIRMDSITTGNEQRDAHLRSPDFFGTDEHPTMDFTATGVRREGDQWILTGDLTIKGITKSVDLTVELEGIGPDAYGGTRAGFSATGTIRRSDFNVTWNAAIEGGGVVVSDKIDIVLDVQVVLNQPTVDLSS